MNIFIKTVIISILFIVFGLSLASAQDSLKQRLEKLEKALIKEKNEFVKLKDSLKKEVDSLRVRSDYWSTAFSTGLSSQTGIFSAFLGVIIFLAGFVSFVVFDNKIRNLENTQNVKIKEIEESNIVFQADNKKKFEAFKAYIKHIEEILLLTSWRTNNNIVHHLDKKHPDYFVNFFAFEINNIRLGFRLDLIEPTEWDKKILYNDLKNIIGVFESIMLNNWNKPLMKSYKNSVLKDIDEIEKLGDKDVRYETYRLKKLMEEYLADTPESPS